MEGEVEGRTVTRRGVEGRPLVDMGMPGIRQKMSGYLIAGLFFTQYAALLDLAHEASRQEIRPLLYNVIAKVESSGHSKATFDCNFSHLRP